MRLVSRLSLMVFGLALSACGEPAAVTPGPAPDAPAAVATAQAPAGAVGSESREFRDWRAVCDNGNRCVAYSGNDTGSWLMVRMDAGPDAGPVVTGNISQISGVTLRLVIDGRAHTLIAGPEDNDALMVRPSDLSTVLTRLAAAREIKLASPDLEAIIPASGLSAALLWIDERQGRLGTTTALIRRGDRPASSVPAAPALPAVIPAPAMSQTGFGDSGQTVPAALEALAAVKTCRAETADSDWIRKEVMSARLDASTELWAVPCFAGAYNIGHDWYVTGPGGRNPRPAALSSASGETGAGTINGGYSPETRTLVAFAKGRGIGDCGIAQTWTWTGRAFVLTQESNMQDCRGIPADQWPTTWRSR